jgi:hypothetical protein
LISLGAFENIDESYERTLSYFKTSRDWIIPSSHPPVTAAKRPRVAVFACLDPELPISIRCKHIVHFIHWRGISKYVFSVSQNQLSHPPLDPQKI